MAGVISVISSTVSEAYSLLTSKISPNYLLAINLLIFSIIIALVSLFIWYFYRTLSQKNIISLNLNRYNTSEHPTLNKVYTVGLYFLEYIIILPFLISLWFAALSIFLLLIAERAAGQVLFITAALIIAIRILAYSHTEISKDLAKLFPFITISVFLLSPASFEFNNVLLRLGEIPSLFSNLFFFLIVMVGVEIIMRLTYTLTKLISQKSEEKGIAILSKR